MSESTDSTRIDEIADGIYRICTPIPEAVIHIPGGFTFNQYLIVDDEPLPSGAKIGAMMTIGPCAFCQKMVLADWQKNDNLKSMLPRIHIDNPAAVWEVGELDLGGKKGIYTYSLSLVGNASSNGLTVYYNNGTNNIMMVMYAHNGPSATKPEELSAWASKDDFIAAAKQLFAPYASNF